MGLGWFDDLGAEAVDKFITGLGHQLSIILLLGYVLLNVTTESAEFLMVLFQCIVLCIIIAYNKHVEAKRERSRHSQDSTQEDQPASESGQRQADDKPLKTRFFIAIWLEQTVLPLNLQGRQTIKLERSFILRQEPVKSSSQLQRNQASRE